jgi:hypothetical protein
VDDVKMQFLSNFFTRKCMEYETDVPPFRQSVTFFHEMPLPTTGEHQDIPVSAFRPAWRFRKKRRKRQKSFLAHA